MQLLLANRDVVRISGEGAHKLLNDTLTCRFDDALAGAGRWFALLSPQGKVQTEGLVTLADGAWWFDIDSRATADFVKRMKLYRLRAKAEIELLPDRAIAWSAGEVDAPIAYADERGIGRRGIVERYAETNGAEPFHAARIARGVPELGADFAANEVFAHDAGLDLLGGIDFVKGCYIGQEVVSRMKHRGTARRRPVLVTGLPEDATAGAPVLAGEREAGTIGLPVDGAAVAIVRLDRLADGEAATVGGMPVRLAIPDWGTYRFGESGTAE